MEIVDDADLGRCDDALVALAYAVLEAEGAEGAVTIALVDERVIADLNMRYRGLDEPTDVLAFADAEGVEGWPDWPPAMPAAGSVPDAGEPPGPEAAAPEPPEGAVAAGERAAAVARAGGGTGQVDGPERTPDLGEVVVCPAVVFRYAEEDGVEPGSQLGWTLVHGILHLLGYDHERDEEEMRGREQALLQRLGAVLKALSLPENT